MPALDFPSSPTNGQVYEQYTYDSTKGAWRVTANPGATVVSSPTAPTSPVSGNLWLNTNDGVLFVYYNDGDTSQWVEVKSNTASGSTVAARVDALELADATTNRSGLVPIIPTSVSVNVGTATVNGTGKISFTGVGTLSLDGVFSAAYDNYVMYIDIPAGTTQTWYRFRASGADRTDNLYGYMAYYADWNGNFAATTPRSSGNQTRGNLTSYFPVTAEIKQPFISTRPTQTFAKGGVINTTVWNAGGFGSNMSVTGISFPFDVNSTGTVQILGVRS
jgi:hypothetical protein